MAYGQTLCRGMPASARSVAATFNTFRWCLGLADQPGVVQGLQCMHTALLSVSRRVIEAFIKQAWLTAGHGRLGCPGG